MNEAEAAPSEPVLGSFPCPACGRPVYDVDPAEDWMCGSCGEVHYGKTPDPAFSDPAADDGDPTTEGDANRSGPSPPQPRQAPDGTLWGDARPFWRSVAMGLLTLGLYFAFYQVQAFSEVDRQAGRRPHRVLYASSALLAVTGAFILLLRSQAPSQEAAARFSAQGFFLLAGAAGLRWLYLGLEVAGLNAARSSIGMDRALSPWTIPLVEACAAFVVWVAPSGVLGPALAIPGLAAVLFAWAVACVGINAFWDKEMQAQELGLDPVQVLHPAASQSR